MVMASRCVERLNSLGFSKGLRDPTSYNSRESHSIRRWYDFLPGPKDSSIQHLIDHVLEHGYVILPSIFTPAQVSLALKELDRLEKDQESGPASQGGRNDFEGFNTRRIYALADKSRAFDCFPIHPTVLKLNDYFLQSNYLLTSYHTVNIEPGSVEQSMHTDDGLVPLPRPRPLLGVVGSSSHSPNLARDTLLTSNVGHHGFSGPVHCNQWCHDTHPRFSSLER